MATTPPPTSHRPEQGPRRARTVWESLWYGVALCSMAVVISGTRACQEDYEVGGQTKGFNPTPSNSNTPTETPTPDGSASPTATATLSLSPTATATATGSPSPSPTDGEPAAFRKVLTQLDKEATPSEQGESGAEGRSNGSPGTIASGSGGANWLGEAFVARVGPDSDGDGFTDEAEAEYGSNPQSGGNAPGFTCASLLRERLAGVDDDGDGLTRGDEMRSGTNPGEADSDGDGCADGAEVWSGSSPVDPKSLPTSRGGFCLGDTAKLQRGLSTEVDDTDADGLVDWLELALGTDPRSADSDGDGIYDGKEVTLGCDPLRRDFLGAPGDGQGVEGR